MSVPRNPKTRTVAVGPVRFGGGLPLALIAGPCVVEDEETPLRIARRLAAIGADCGVPIVFKASYDKANRSSIHSFRGIGMAEGLDVLRRVRAETGLPLLSDVHDVTQVGPAAKVLDCLQVPAFLCRQTDLLVAVAKSGRAVNVKKGQFLAPWDMKNVLSKLEAAGADNVFVTDRGVAFGYGTLISDMRAIPKIQALGPPVVFDGTHSVQQPGGLGDRSGGEREMVPFLVRAAVAAGADALFLEVHEDPEKALSDGPNMLYLDDLPELLRETVAIRNVLTEAGSFPPDSMKRRGSETRGSENG
jgi:2-dehydro-3-deoxyphosphooctonate aldolase (KDO 8-P synthase)